MNIKSNIVVNPVFYLFLIGMFFCVNSFAQDTSIKYPFIKQEFNHLNFSNDSSGFLFLYKKMDQLKRDKNIRLKIVHMGGSHVQGGIWSNTFSSNFQKENKTSGGGYFTFPYKIAKTNGQPYARSFSTGKWKRCRANGKEFCQPLGMCALSVTTNDSITNFGVALTSWAACKKINQVKVFHNFNPSFEFVPVLKDSNKVQREEVPANGYSLFKFSVPVDSVSFELFRKDTFVKDFTLYGLSLENDTNSGVYLAALGANGASSSSFLRCSNLLPQLETLQADLFVLSLGVNDTQSKDFTKEDYVKNYDTLITYIKRTNPNAAIMLSTTTDNFIKRKTPNKRTAAAREAMYELMYKHNVAVWDLYKVMGGYRSMLNWQKAGLASKDRVHFTGRGYAVVGNLMFNALNKSYTNNQVKQ